MYNKFKLIAAVDSKAGIGLNNGIPWDYPEDLANFKKKTDGGVVVMGHTTFQSIGKPLPGRTNIVFTTNRKALEGKDVITVASVEELDKVLGTIDHKDNVWVIGGKSIYEMFLSKQLVSELYITRVPGNYRCDVRMLTCEFKSQPNSAVWRLAMKSNQHFTDRPSITYEHWVRR